MAFSSVPHTAAQGYAGVVDSAFNRNFFLDAAGGVTSENHIIAAGQTLEAGSVVGMVTASSELVFCDPAAGDGSEVPYAIVPQPLDTTAGAVETGVWTHSLAMINLNALVYHAAWGKKQLRAAMKRAGFPAIRTPQYSAI
jgi:hypothetical protein